MKKKRVSAVKNRMLRIFPAAIVYFLFLLFSMASSRGGTLPNHLKLSSALTCRLVGGLTREQRAVCQETPDTVSIAFEGLQLAVKECQHQFRWHRWNCSNLITKSSNPHTSGIMKRANDTIVRRNFEFKQLTMLRLGGQRRAASARSREGMKRACRVAAYTPRYESETRPHVT
ncbi:unnamed protein product [Diatraea saccharalis]|uniref:Protein Wnt n=1 Tax=Diatraea saccharalis TaxID=40085 RepID=A0A9N9QWF5_9NEOP|nr:unnamed protein product [Diatraea saccharalis]